MRDEIALIDTLLIDVLIHLNGTSEDQPPRAKAIAALSDLQTALLAEDGDAAQDASLRLESALREGAEAQHRLAPVLTLIEERRRLVDTERRRLLAGEKAIRIDELMNLIAAVVDVIRRHVPDQEARRAISDEIRLLIGDGTPN